MRDIRNAALLLLLACDCVLAQTPSAEVKKFIAYDDAVIALTHVRVIDGTGAAPQENRTIVLRAGKIASIADAATPPACTIT
jgi:hypothetical protein